jgi:hypothetical protein
MASSASFSRSNARAGPENDKAVANIINEPTAVRRPIRGYANDFRDSSIAPSGFVTLTLCISKTYAIAFPDENHHL